MDDNDKNVDVCLVLEGVDPSVTGGVSVWVEELTRNMPDVRFAVADVGGEAAEGDPDASAALAEQLPDASIYHACITGSASDAAAAAAASRGRPLLVTEHGLAWREAGWISGCNPHGRGLPPAERVQRVQRVARQARDASG